MWRASRAWRDAKRRPGNKRHRAARDGRTALGARGSPTAIVQRAALADALIDGRGVQDLDAKGKAAGEIKAVWRWIKRRI